MEDSNHPAETGYFRNWVSLSGMGLMLVSLFFGVLFAVQEVVSGKAAPYSGFLYVLCTVSIVLGFLLVPLGALIERWRRKGGRRARPLSQFHFDLRNREPIGKIGREDCQGGFVAVPSDQGEEPAARRVIVRRPDQGDDLFVAEQERSDQAPAEEAGGAGQQGLHTHEEARAC